MAFVKGKSGNTNGRPKGEPNKLTKTVKETILGAFNDLQEDPRANIFSWAKENPTEFYKIASKLIPTEISANITANKPIIIDWTEGNYTDKSDT